MVAHALFANNETSSATYFQPKQKRTRWASIATLPTAREIEAFLLPTRSENGPMRVLRTLGIYLREEPGESVWCATDRGVSSVYGAGDTPMEAAEDYRESLLNQFLWLEDNEDELSDYLLNELASLRNYLAKR